MARVSVIIPNWNTRRWLPGCLDGLRAQSYRDFRVIVVDNGSSDDSVAFIRQNYPEVEVLAFNRNRGFAAAVNAGIEASRSELVALLNVDTAAHPEWLESLVAAMDQCPPRVGSLASKMLSLQNPQVMDDAGNTFSWYGSAYKRGQREPANRYDQPEEVFSACAAAALYRRAFLEDVGGFDEGFVSYLEDVDLGLRGQLLGWRCRYVPAAVVLHQWSGAGIPRPQYVFLSTRNRLALLVKNIPWPLLLRHSYTLLFGQFYFFLVYKKPLYSLAGITAFLLALPRLLRQRRQIQKRRVMSLKALDGLLLPELGEPRLRDIARKRLGRLS